MTKDKPFDVLDATMFYEDREVSTLMRQLYRMDYEEKDASRIFKSWLKRRKHRIEDVPMVYMEDENDD